MIDKNLLRLLGSNRKYIYIALVFMVIGLLSSVAITAALCYAIHLLTLRAEPTAYLAPLLLALGAILVRYFASGIVGDLKDTLGRRAKKDLRERVYNKIVRLGVRSTDGMSMAGLTQVSMEGVEQLDLYSSSYIPQFFYAMLAPFILFGLTVGIEWRVAVVLLCCVPLIPVSIIAVSKYAKRIFAKYWGKYTSMGDAFLDSVQGLKELKIYQADGAQHEKMNETSEEFRKITMKVLVMQLASTTIMDLVAYGGAGLGIAMAILSVMLWDLAPISALFLILLAVDFFLPLRAFGSAFHVAMNGASAGKKILSLLDQPEGEWGTETAVCGELLLEDVSFSYDGVRDALRSVDMHFARTGMQAIVGESGCGKSTVVNMLFGAYRPQKGRVTVGGRPLSELSRESYYSHLAVVSYNTYVFHASVRENFMLARQSVTEMLTVGYMIVGVVTVFSSFGPVIAISALPGNLTQTFASGDRVLDLLAEKPVVEPVQNGKPFSFEELSVRELSFSYDGESEILHKLSMQARRGEIVGIVGESGCGKSTFLKLLLRFWQKTEGEILYNGTDIEEIDGQSLLDNVTMVSQVTYLFDETIEDNLRIARPTATQAEMEAACRMASVHEFIMTLPEGYKTRVGALGDNLSAGEKQRIGLARAFLCGAPVILLDEPTSNVDSINEGIILKALRAQRADKCIILVSHRESTMAIADRVYRVEAGAMRALA